LELPKISYGFLKRKRIYKTFIKTFVKTEKDFIKQDDISMTSKVSGPEAAH
jgi:hypothetical protein